MTTKFSQEKQELLNNLKTYYDKLLFPKKVIKSLNLSGLSTLSSFFEKYSNYIKKIRELYDKLVVLNSWNMFYNSHYLWIKSVSFNIENLKIYANEIFNYINGSETDIYKKMIMAQNNVNSTNLLLFINIQKKNNKYILPGTGHGDIDDHELLITDVVNLLPTCINVDSDNVVGKKVSGLYKNINELDESDIFINVKNENII